ncbi:MAG: hypothetical protein LH475_03250 [Cryobacterium sp.]|uniref:hypothetical protein n=1 Tax=unclassified Cryobacterium TaxID=2649013 RepID=UPI0018C8EFA4|nr:MULTISPECIES: hypothetical protein [unclassified Cryobacterium]MCY7403640.1 hypothetical protein [Cryobacterium sp.]
MARSRPVGLAAQNAMLHREVPAHAGSAAGVDFEMSVRRGIDRPAGIDDYIVAELDCHLQ